MADTENKQLVWALQKDDLRSKLRATDVSVALEITGARGSPWSP